MRLKYIKPLAISLCSPLFKSINIVYTNHAFLADKLRSLKIVKIEEGVNERLHDKKEKEKGIELDNQRLPIYLDQGIYNFLWVAILYHPWSYWDRAA